MNESTGDGSEVRRLRNIADQLLTLASEIEAKDRDHGGAAATRLMLSGHMPRLRDPAPGRIAEWVYRHRRMRSAVFGDDSLFGEPAWDILLDLFIADRAGKDLNVASVCSAAAVPPTTALRWIGILEQKGLAQREHDTRDARRVIVRLTPKGRDRMNDYCARAEVASAPQEAERPGVEG